MWTICTACACSAGRSSTRSWIPKMKKPFGRGSLTRTGPHSAACMLALQLQLWPVRLPQLRLVRVGGSQIVLTSSCGDHSLCSLAPPTGSSAAEIRSFAADPCWSAARSPFPRRYQQFHWRMASPGPPEGASRPASPVPRRHPRSTALFSGQHRNNASSTALAAGDMAAWNAADAAALAQQS